MSHRVTYKTQITNATSAQAALRQLGWKFSLSGDTLNIQSGPLNRASVNLKTGLISGDTDWHKDENCNAFRQAYTEAEFKRHAVNMGITIESREVETNGNIVLMCVTA